MNDNYLLYIKLFTFPKGMPTALLYIFYLEKNRSEISSDRFLH